MYGGMRFTQEQIRALPLQMQETIGLAIAMQLKKNTTESENQKGECNETNQGTAEGRTVSV